MISRCSTVVPVVMAALAVTAAGCGRDDDGAEIAVLRVAAGDSAARHGEYHFEVPATVPAGATRVELVNDGAEPHHAQVFQLADHATVDELVDALTTGGAPAAAALGSFAGGTALVAPDGQSQAEAVIDLEPGHYVLMCLVPDSTGTPHLAHGMLRSFEVVEDDEPAPLPDADVEVQLLDYAFDVPATIDGDATVAVTNSSQAEPHEMVVMQVDEGVTRDDIVAALHAGDPLPGAGVGGMQAIPPGTTQLLHLDLAPGRYFVICVVPLPDGRPHVDAGMIAEVTVT
jgi:uncharacterized cupredoxin-like copper-binding protein